MWGRTEIVLKGESRWVTDGYLSDDKPLAAAAGLSMEPCPDGSVESGLTDGAVYVYRSVCHAFPQITSYGGWDAHGEHSSGRALDIMTSDVELGTAIAEFLQSHASELHLYDIIWRQHIWTPVRASARAGGRCRRVVRRPPTTTTTSTWRCTEPSAPARHRSSSLSQMSGRFWLPAQAAAISTALESAHVASPSAWVALRFRHGPFEASRLAPQENRRATSSTSRSARLT